MHRSCELRVHNSHAAINLLTLSDMLNNSLLAFTWQQTVTMCLTYNVSATHATGIVQWMRSLPQCQVHIALFTNKTQYAHTCQATQWPAYSTCNIDKPVQLVLIY